MPIKFKGLKADGSQVNITFTTPGNNANSFEAYLLGQDFASGLTNVEIHAARWAMDNLVVITGAAASPPNTVAVTPAQFGPPANFPTGNSPNALVVADFNRRGKLDIAVASYYNGVSLLRGMGDGTFSGPTNYTANGTGALATGDFNGDGKLDIVTRGYYGGSVLLNDGMGSFVRTNYTWPNDYESAAVPVGDFNRDGKLDFAGGYAGGFLIDFGLGNGSFGAPTNYFFASGSSDVVAADFNGDGMLDLAATPYSASTNSIGVLMNNGDGTFAAPLYYHLVNTNDYHYSLAVGDFNGDGKPDVAVLNYNARSVTIWLNNGQWFWTAKDYLVGFSPTSIAGGDFNGDGKLDLIARGGSAASVLLGNGDGSFTIGAQMAVPYDSSKGLVTVAVGDFNGDGLLDLAFTSDNNNSVAIMLNQTPPALKFTPMVGYNQISWPALFGAFTLEYTTNLSAPDSWQPFPYPPVVIGNQKAVADWTDGRQKFYRLRKP